MNRILALSGFACKGSQTKKPAPYFLLQGAGFLLNRLIFQVVQADRAA